MRSLRVLVVEQHPARLLQLHQMLNACGVYAVRVAEDCQAARTSLEQQGPADIIIFGSQATSALVFLDNLAEATSTAALIIQQRTDSAETAAALRRARHAGLLVLGVLPLGEATCPLHSMLKRFIGLCAEPLIA
jgi:DNA-binding NarL/FixJ family response regulator